MNLLKYYYKYLNRTKYLEIKQTQKGAKRIKNYNQSFKSVIEKINQNLNNKKELNFLHSGHLGDIIYALPVVKELSKTHTCNLYIQANKPFDSKNYLKHPAGNVFLNKKLVDWIVPLLEKQPYLNKVKIYNQENIDVNFDEYRNMPVDFCWLSVRWFFHLTGIFADVDTPWIDIEPHSSIKDNIVIVRSFRARNYMIDYSFLNNYDNLIFIGLKEEYNDLLPQIPNLSFYDCKDFIEMAQIIKSSRLFIGNQSFAYSLAEAMKVPRLLEAFPDFPVVHPTGKSGKDFYFQIHFEKFVNEFLS